MRDDMKRPCYAKCNTQSHIRNPSAIHNIFEPVSQQNTRAVVDTCGLTPVAPA